MTTLFFAAAAPENTPDAISVETAVLILLTGGLLYCFKAIADLRRQLGQRPPAGPAKSSPAVPAAPPPALAPASAPPPEIVAAIAAAVHYLVGPHHRVRAIVPAPLPGGERWSVEGRREVFHSHQLR